MNPPRVTVDQQQSRNSKRRSALSFPLNSSFRQWVAVMGSGDIVVGNAIPKPGQSTVNDPASADPPRPSRPRQQHMCGAMTQQGDDSRATSQPQEFVRLVGYRNPKIRPPRAPG
jgi:hypothetical protein